MTPSLVDQVVQVAASLDASGVPWAFGGALALAYATSEPRGTRDIDVNVFVVADHAAEVFASLPSGVDHAEADLLAASRDAQVRLFWGHTPVDVFFAADPFHFEAAHRCRVVPFSDRSIRVLGAEDLAVFKALFDRPKDWVDIASMAEARALDIATAAGRLESLLGDDSRVARLRALGG